MHDHPAVATTDNRRLGLAFFLALVVLVTEAVGGFVSHSLALLADAGHMLTDVVALGLSWFAVRQAERPPDAAKTYGYHRTGILVALCNAATLILIALWIAYEAYQRLTQPREVYGLTMVVVALAGLIIWWTRWYPIDPLLSVVIALLIALGAWQIAGDTVNILMEATPRGLDMEEVAREIRRIDGVRDVHDLHVWSIAPGMHNLSCHVDIEDRYVASSIRIIFNICRMLQERFGIDHTTIQPECESCDPNSLYCVLPQSQVPTPKSPVR